MNGFCHLWPLRSRGTSGGNSNPWNLSQPAFGALGEAIGGRKIRLWGWDLQLCWAEGSGQEVEITQTAHSRGPGGRWRVHLPLLACALGLVA